MKKILILLFILFSVLLVSCDVVTEDKEYTVTFDILGSVTEVKVQDGDTLKEDQIPNTDIMGMEFEYWARVVNGIDFEFDIEKEIRRDYNLYARYEDISGLNEITISLHGLNGNVVLVDSIPINTSYQITYNTNISGYTFVGWYLDSGFNTPYSEVTLTQDTDIYGKWRELDVVTYLVTFIGRTGEQFSKATVEEGETVSKPTNTNISGYRFINWYTSGSFTTVFNFDTPITSNTTIYGKWEVYESNHYPYNGNYYNNIDFNNFNATEKAELKTLLEVQSARSYSSGSSRTSVGNAAADPNISGNIILIYNGDSVKKNTSSNWNQEHVWPRATLPDSVEGDRHNLWPCDYDVNTQRGSLKFVAGSGSFKKISGGWYPGDEWIGDVARVCMYMALRYDVNISSVLSPSLALQWSEADPVTQWEMTRNDLLFNSGDQDNRNPFIDHPELAQMLFGSSASGRRLAINTINNTYVDIILIKELNIYFEKLSNNFVRK